MVIFVLAALFAGLLSRDFFTSHAGSASRSNRAYLIRCIAGLAAIAAAAAIWLLAIENERCLGLASGCKVPLLDVKIDWLTSRIAAVACFGVVFGLCCERWIAELPSPGSARAEKTTFASQLPWMLLTGALFALALFFDPQLDLMRHVKSFKAGAVELQFENALQSGQANRLQLHRLNSDRVIGGYIEEIEKSLVLENQILDARLDAGRIGKPEHDARKKYLATTKKFFAHVLAPLVKCANHVQKSASLPPVLAAIAPAKVHLRAYLTEAAPNVKGHDFSDGEAVVAGARIDVLFDRLERVAKEVNFAMTTLRRLDTSTQTPQKASENQSKPGPCTGSPAVSAKFTKSVAHHLSFSPFIYRLTATMYAASRQFEEVPSILPEEVINHFTFDDGLLNRRADSYAELQKPDFDSAIVDARKRLVLIKNNLAVFRPGTVPELLSKREMRAKNNLAYYLAEAEQDLSDAVSLAKEALEAEPENISRADTYAYARLVRAVKDKSMTAPARSAEIVQAIRLFEDALSRARKSDKKELEQMLGLHLQQAKEVYEVSK